MSGGQYRLIHLTISGVYSAQFSLYVHKSGLKPVSVFFQLTNAYQVEQVFNRQE